MVHEVLAVGPLQANCSICGDEQTREAIVIDPGDEASRILDVVRRHHLRLTAIVLTHAHIDHAGAAPELRAATAAQVYLHEGDRELLAHLDSQASWLGLEPLGSFEPDEPLREGDRLCVGATELQVLHTPGHTPGSICLWIPAGKKLIAGDTLFRDGIGRTDLPGGNERQILASIKEKLLPLPDETVVTPGHGPETTIGRERELNYFVRAL